VEHAIRKARKAIHLAECEENKYLGMVYLELRAIG